MGTCVSKTPDMPLSVFKAKNIDESGRTSGVGYLEVTDVNLVFRTQSNNGIRQHEWPLKWLRKYGCDGDIFSFEAGHKCQGGEGIYAFSTKHAAKVFELVQNNIVQGQQSGRHDSSNGTLEAKETGRQRAVSDGTKRRSPPKEAPEKSTRSQTLPASGAVSGSSLTSDSDALQDKIAKVKPLQAPPPIPVTPVEKPPTEPTQTEAPPAKVAQEKEKAKFGYAKLDLNPSSEEKPIITKHSKTNYAQLLVEDGQSSFIPTGNGAAVGPTTEYVNYTPGQGVLSEESTEAHTGAAMYSNLDYSSVTQPSPGALPAPPQVSYAQLDFSKNKSPEREGKGSSVTPSRSLSPSVGDGGSGERLHTGSVSSLGTGGAALPKGGIEHTNYAQLDYNAMETVQHLPTREKVQRH